MPRSPNQNKISPMRNPVLYTYSLVLFEKSNSPYSGDLKQRNSLSNKSILASPSVFYEAYL
jgi:hypothetical protein